MDILSLLFLAAALAMDAFSAAVTDGMIVKKIRFYDAIKVGLFFGVFQFLMPCIGNLVSGFATDIVERFDHWIAFVLLVFIGGSMIKEAFGKEEINASMNFQSMLLLAIATSIDALAVGVSFAFLQVKIIPAVSFIGVITFLFSAVGVKIGSIFGDKYRSKAEICGGVILILIGLKTLLDGIGILG